ncbi:hypothetical protein SDC9_126930 [bioreactor metagenome]|uniref:Uncharacterized protein n=1 Tax=bioreactor metagenome TaxID=1076179 RepID=A0A645CSP3_9ZZZZ
MVSGVGAQPSPGLGDRDRPCGREGLSESAVPFQSGRDRRVVGRAQHHRDLPRRQPSRRRQVGGTECGDEGVHLLPQHGGSTAYPASGGPDLPRARLHVQAQRERGGVAFAGGSGAVDEFGVGVGRPRPVGGAVGGPPFGESGARVRQGPLQDLKGGDPPGAADGREHAAPGADAAFLFAGVEEHERGMGDLAHHGQGGRVGVVDHPGPGVGVGVFTQARHVAGQGEGSDGARDDDPAPVEQLSAGGAPQPPAGDGQPLHDGPACDGYPGQRGGEYPDGGGVGEQHPAAGVEGADECGSADGERDELGQRQAEEDAAAGEAGELHRHEFARGGTVVVRAAHRLLLRWAWRGRRGLLRRR